MPQKEKNEISPSSVPAVENTQVEASDLLAKTTEILNARENIDLFTQFAWEVCGSDSNFSVPVTIEEKNARFTAVPYIFEIVIFVLLFELALIVFLNYPFPVFPFR